MRKHRLHKVFEPQSVAVVGASDKVFSVGGQLFSRLADSDFQGELYPVNPGHDSIRGRPCYAAIGDIKQPLDLVVIVVPAPAVAQLVHQCGEHGVGAVIIISAGFAEMGPQGQALQDEVVGIARSYNIALVGPNCLGVIRPSAGLNASFAKSKVAPGHVALVAQSGAFCTSLLDWGASRGFGFSAVASLGATADVGFGEVLDYLALDPHTKSILLYIEGVSNARAFISGLRAAARLKPVIVIKSGRSEHGSRAAVSHTGALAGGDAVFDAAISRAGAVRVASASQLIAAAQTLASGTRVEGSRLAVLTNGGGPGVMAADRAADLKVPLAELSSPTLDTLGEALPAHWSHANPVDILGDASSERYGAATGILLADTNVDCLLVLLSPQGLTDPTACARAVIAAATETRKPVLTCWLGDGLVNEGRQLFIDAGIPTFPSPETGVDAFGCLAAYRRNQNTLLQAPPPLSKNTAPDVAGARLTIESAMCEHRYTLNNTETQAVLRAFHIPVAASLYTGSAAKPMKDRPHAREVMIGIARDPVFGPVINFGAGGIAAAIFGDRNIALPPLNDYLAWELIQGTRTFSLLQSFRNLPDANIDRLLETLRRVSEMACELPELQALDINPLLVDEAGVCALDTRITVAPVKTGTGLYSHMAVHPYPAGLATVWHLPDDIDVAVRPIRPEDASLEREFVDNLSSQSKYFRFMNRMDKISPLMLARFTQIDYDREMALVAVINEHTPEASIIGVARYIGNPDRESCEFALTIADDWQHRGIGRQLMRRLITVAQERGLEIMEGDVLAQNARMLRLCKALDFHIVHDHREPELVVVRREL